jgi:hypothetical protein
MTDETARATGRWTTDEDAKLISAVANTSKKKWGNDYKTDWDAVAALVPGRTKKVCYDRWHHVLDPSIYRASELTGKWTPDEDIKLKPNVVATRATGRWTTDEDAQLTSAVANTSEKKWGNEYKTDWDAVAALVLGRTRNQCKSRWKDVLDPSVEGATICTGKWAEDEDIKLKDDVERHGGKNWDTVAALVPDRSRSQCRSIWHNGLDSSVEGATICTGKWAEDEDIKLKDAVKRHGGKNWKDIAVLVPGRTELQCRDRWKNGLDQASARKGKWVEDEDIKLKDAVKRHGGKNWKDIAVLVPGRTEQQCRDRWKNGLDSSMDGTTKRTCKWTPEEDVKLKDSVEMHGGKDWAAITALIPGRTRSQCRNRWKDGLDPKIDRTNGRTGKWAKDEDIVLKDAVQTHGGKNWAAIAKLVSGRTTSQCSTRWMKALNPSIDHANGLKGKWTEDEDSKLKDSVQRHGGKDWDAISALIPGRTEKQCQNRWHNALVLKTVLPTERRGKWAKDEDIKLKDAVQTYGGNNWVAIAVLVPGRTKKQCYDRWHNASDYRIDKAETDVQVP